jgi:hypothetical protein
VVGKMAVRLVDIWSNGGLRGGDVTESVIPPGYHDLLTDLQVLRRAGLSQLRDLQLRHLTQAARASGFADGDEPVTPPTLRAFLRQAVSELGNGRLGETAGIVLGLHPEYFGDEPPALRKAAAERWGVSLSRFRREPEQRVLGEIADVMLERCSVHQLRLAHLALERRLPTTSRLAIAWIERFEAYNRLWTPIYAVGANLTAFRSTLFEEDRPYDQFEGRADYSQELQASGYASYALFHFAAYLGHLQDFMVRHGGLWLLSDHRAEQELSDAVYRIGWHSPFNEQDDARLRWLWGEAAEQNLDRFRDAVEGPNAPALHSEWQAWANTCACQWPDTEPTTSTPFPTHRQHAGIVESCQVHAMIAACGDYCALVDDDWHRIADWYHLPSKPLPSLSGEQLYRRHVVEPRNAPEG